MNIAIIDCDLARIKRCQAATLTFQGCQIVWIAQTKEETIRKVKFNRPDLILVAIECRDVIDVIMKESPTAILLIVETLENQGELIYQTMNKGALDVAVVSSKGDTKELSLKMQMLHFLIKSGSKFRKKERSIIHDLQTTQYPPLVVIGASTGGPAAIAKLLKSLPDECPFATVIVQHVDATFTLGLAEWLAEQSELPCAVAKAGARPEKGKILLASTNDHLVISSENQFHYTPYPLENTYRPSIDVFFDSVSRNWPQPGVAVLLTGMGSDGALGLKKLSDNGWYTIVEHEESCAVYGMPKAAIKAGASRIVLPIDEIGKRIVEVIT